MNTATFRDVLGRHNITVPDETIAEITVPAEIGSAVAAAAWQFGVDADMYQQLERAT